MRAHISSSSAAAAAAASAAAAAAGHATQALTVTLGKEATVAKAQSGVGGPRAVPEDPDFDIVDRDEAEQPELTEAQRKRKALGEARAARSRDSTFHARKAKLPHLIDHLPQALWDAFLDKAVRPRVKAISERGVIGSLLLGFLVRGLCTLHVADQLDAQGQPLTYTDTDIPVSAADIPNLSCRNLFLQLCRGLPGDGENTRPSAAVAAVLAAHPDLCARLEAIPRHLSDSNMVDHVGKELETALSNILTLLFAGRLKKAVSLAGAKVLLGTNEHQRRFGVRGLVGGHLPAWSKRQCTYVRRIVCGLEVTWLVGEGGVVVTAAMQAEVALQRALLGLGEGEKRLLNLPVSAQRKRIALLRALAGHNATHQQQHDLPNVAAAFSQTLASLGQHMPCRLDLSLPRSLPSGQHYLVAANLRQNEQLMPHFIKQLLLVLLEHLTETGADHDGTLLVSIYESGSTDATPQYLAVLEVLLEALGVPHTITAAGQLSRLGAERIHFLAKVRNTALLPLWHSKHHSGGFPAQRIVFLNDVWFCHQDVVRLAQYRTADIACGLDFDRYAPRRHLMRALRDTSLVPPLPSAPETLGAGAGKEGGGAGAALRWAEQQTRRLQAQGTRGGAGAGGVDGMGGSTGVGADTAGLEHLLAALQEALGWEHDTITPHSHTPASSPMASTSPPWPRQSTPGQNHSLSPSNGEDWAGGEEEQRLWALLREVQSRLNVSSQAAAETVADGSSGSSTSSTSSASSASSSSSSSYASSVTSVDGGAGQGHGLRRAGARQLLGQSPWLAFYDTWVARDITGQRFDKGFPVVSHGPSAQALKQGWPFPVTCCWNGLVVLNAEPFRQRGLQFRAHGPGECAASECSLMCDDFWRLGYSRALVDPSTYAPWDPYLYYDNLLGEAVPMRPWSNLLQHAAQQGWYHPTPPTPLAQKQAHPPPSPVFEPLPPTSNATNSSIPSSTVPSNSSSADTGGSEFVMSGGVIDQAKHPEVVGSTPGILTWLHRMVGGLQPSTSGPSLNAAPAADSSANSASNQAPQLPGAGRAGLRQERHKRLRLRQQEQPVETDQPSEPLAPGQAALHVPHKHRGGVKAEQRQLRSPGRLPPPPDPVQGLWRDVKAPATEVCCDKQEFADWVNFGACQARPFLQPNHTATALVTLRSQNPSQLQQGRPPQAPRSSQAATQAAASEPGPSTPQPAKRSKRTKAEPGAAEPTKGKGKAAKAKPAPQPGRWLDRDCNAALNMQRIGESRWRPLELCFWPDQGALPAKGKEYPGLGYKRLRDKPPKAQEQQQQPAEAQYLDLSLPRSLPSGQHYLVAANLRQNEQLMPHFIKQLLLVLLEHLTETGADHDGTLLVSIYESGSTDATPQYLAVLEVLLEALGVPHTITAAGQLSRLGAERIHFLAKVRNTALLPLWHSKHHSGGFPAQRIVFLNDVWFCHQDVVRLSQYRTADIACGLDFDRYAPRRHLMRALRDTSLVPPLPSAPETLGAGAGKEGGGSGAALRWAEQQSRRLQAQGTRGGAGAGGVDGMGGSTGVGADIAGLEHLLAALQEALGWEPDTITPPSHTPSSSPTASTSPPWPRQITPGQNHSLSPSNGEDWAGGEEEQRLWALLREVQSRLNVSSQAAPETVAAGSSGSSTSSASSSASSVTRQRFHNGFPVVSHGPSAQALKEGWPFPVTCCWNGLVVLNAEPFRQRGLQFRAHGPGECAASECSLMCDDFWRLGYSRALVDPSTYAPWDPYLYYDNLLGEAVPLRPWSNLLQHAAQQGWYHPTPPTPLVQKQAHPPPSPVFEPLPATSNATNSSSPSSTVPSNSSTADTGGSEFVMSGGVIDQAQHPEVIGSTPGILTWLHRMVGGLQPSTSGPSLHAAPAADSSANPASNQAPQLPGAGRAGLRQERHKRLRLRQQEQPVETDHPLGKAGPGQAALHVLHRRGGRMKLEQRQLTSPVRLPPPPDPVQGLWRGVKAPATQVCCDKHAIADWVDFGACQARPFLEPNHTATALVALKNRDLAQLKQFYDRDVSAALNIRRCAVGPGPRPTELSRWEGRPAMPKLGHPGQEWVYVPVKALLRKWRRKWRHTALLQLQPCSPEMTAAWSLSAAQRDETARRVASNLFTMGFTKGLPISDDQALEAAISFEEKAYTAASVAATTTTGNRPLSETTKAYSRKLSEQVIELIKAGGIVAAASQDPQQCSGEELDLFGSRDFLTESSAKQALAPLLARGSSIRKVRLSTKSFGRDAATVAASALANVSATLTDVDISDIIAGRPEDEALDALRIISAALLPARLARVNLSDNALGEKGVRAAGDLLSKQPALEALSLQNVGCSIHACRAVEELLQQTTSLSSLQLFNNMSDNQGALHIATVLAHSPHMADFRMASSRVGPSGGIALAKALTTGRHLVKLDISDNPMTAAVGPALAALVLVQPCLKILNVNDTSLTDKGAMAVAVALGNSSCQLEELEMALNEITPAGAKAVAAAVASKGGSLKRVNLRENELEDRGAVIIARGLAKAPGLVSIDLCGNQLKRVGAVAVAKAAANSCAGLTLLALDENTVSDTGLDEVRDIMEAAGKGEALGPLDENMEEDDEELEEEEDEEDGDDTSDLSALLAKTGLA
ncbi:hypothetical protein QJQ45_025289 [Haematococcus lacustris]|nr:hypothetical protein QJQ45_025289 [Haematococcus lacustris]